VGIWLGRVYLDNKIVFLIRIHINKKKSEHFQNSVKKNKIKSVKKFELFEALAEFSNFKISFYFLAILELRERFSFAYFSLLKRKVRSIMLNI
jgi:hypothetical protein